jgi:hypothetical protein
MDTGEITMSLVDRPDFLRNVLLVDAITCVATGALMTLGADLVAGLTQLPKGLLTSAGLSLFPIAAFMAFVATRRPPPRPGVWLVIIGNVGWVLASVLLLLSGAIAPNGLGYAFVTMQAIAVALLAELEFMGLRRMPLAA